MKNILIISLGLLAFFSSATFATAQTLKATNFEFIGIAGLGHALGSPDLADVLSVTMPSTKDPKWTVVFKDGTILVTTYPVELAYRSKNQHSHSDEIVLE